MKIFSFSPAKYVQAHVIQLNDFLVKQMEYSIDNECILKICTSTRNIRESCMCPRHVHIRTFMNVH